MADDRFTDYLNKFSADRVAMLEQLRQIVVGQSEVIEQVLAAADNRPHRPRRNGKAVAREWAVLRPEAEGAGVEARGVISESELVAAVETGAKGHPVAAGRRSRGRRRDSNNVSAVWALDPVAGPIVTQSQADLAPRAVYNDGHGDASLVFRDRVA